LSVAAKVGDLPDLVLFVLELELRSLGPLELDAVDHRRLLKGHVLAASSDQRGEAVELLLVLLGGVEGVVDVGKGGLN
jgi:hypothetical protein